ncbi:hypothetical protein BJ138DRAFT_1105919 [Hygrophoropsis aurantiaca]|uniref:Uncharacterized protein n=2 Tax=Hygrophoropsis aurantiaca TaxID=72124 RepID=A0ACB7ZYT5_9AGAM|nr:hypothetical protein BJ138DRAFT_1105992 [Hygrophoropsis aurantiaca]KAH7905518.1 hypothetical protein BJ138DRAFT_1105919 [Hygrophoropsis aurantiaca]
MTEVQGTVQTGLYIITNVATGGYATLADGNISSGLTQTTDDGNDDIKWNVTKLSGGKYTVAGLVFANYASASHSPNSGDTVKSSANNYQWIIKQSNTAGQYLISPVDNDSLYWSFSGQTATYVKLSDTADYWTFTRVTS